MRHLDENASAITGVGLTTAGTTVIEIAQHLDGLLQDAVGLAPLHVHDEADTTRLVFEPGIVQTLLLRLSGPTAWTSVALALHNEFPTSSRLASRTDSRRAGAFRPGADWSVAGG